MVIDSVGHAYNVDPSNFARPEVANPLMHMLYGVLSSAPPELSPIHI